jgi:hypothetical protein
MGKPLFVMTAKAPVWNLEIYDCRLASLRIGLNHLTRTKVESVFDRCAKAYRNIARIDRGRMYLMGCDHIT